jgi:hypothetical protein
MKYIFAFDLSLVSTGYTIADKDFNIVEIGTIPTNSKFRVDQRLHFI